MLQFGPDGMLYVALGDGGGIADQYGNGQAIDTLLGAILRISVDGPEPYAVPADNPFVDDDEGAPEIWVYGLRNPWRFWIDDGVLYIGDVGQETWEEVDVVPLYSPGANFGWSVMEGDECFEADDCDSDGMVPPLLQYGHGEGCAVIGGVVYRGAAIPELTGHYFYGDFCRNRIRSFRFVDGAVDDPRDWSDDLDGIGQLLSFGTDSNGEIYMSTGTGAVYRLAPAG
jgi:glucose/arabinose dehydrogenase